MLSDTIFFPVDAGLAPVQATDSPVKKPKRVGFCNNLIFVTYVTDIIEEHRLEIAQLPVARPTRAARLTRPLQLLDVLLRRLHP